jgi:hypothetical protein
MRPKQLPGECRHGGPERLVPPVDGPKIRAQAEGVFGGSAGVHFVSLTRAQIPLGDARNDEKTGATDQRVSSRSPRG